MTLREAGKKSPAVLVFSFTRIVGRFTTQPFKVTVPVPDGDEGTGGQVVLDLEGVA